MAELTLDDVIGYLGEAHDFCREHGVELEEDYCVGNAVQTVSAAAMDHIIHMVLALIDKHLEEMAPGDCISYKDSHIIGMSVMLQFRKLLLQELQNRVPLLEDVLDEHEVGQGYFKLSDASLDVISEWRAIRENKTSIDALAKERGLE